MPPCGYETVAWKTMHHFIFANVVFEGYNGQHVARVTVTWLLKRNKSQCQCP